MDNEQGLRMLTACVCVEANDSENMLLGLQHRSQSIILFSPMANRVIISAIMTTQTAPKIAKNSLTTERIIEHLNKPVNVYFVWKGIFKNDFHNLSWQSRIYLQMYLLRFIFFYY